MASNSIQILINAKDNASSVIEGTSNALVSLKDKAVLAAKVGLAAVATGATAATVAGFSFNSSVEQAQATIQAFTKDAGLTAKILADVKEESLKTQFSFTDMANATAGLIPASKQSGVALKDLIKQAEILAALNPAEGLTGAAFSLKEALSGDFVSIVERFNLPRQRLNELKAQGVPAMQAIQTALKEMGIDYDLVAKQGQTTAARWDTMKDQFTQLAGAVSKPIFDKVSEGLSKLSESIDWEEWTKRGTDAINGSITVFRMLWDTISGGDPTIKQGEERFAGLARFLNMARDVVMDAWGALKKFLGPSLEALWGTIKKDLLPAFKQLLPYVDDVAKIIGGVLVAALWVAINYVRISIRVWSDMVKAFFTVKDAIGTAVDAIARAFQTVRDLAINIWNGMVDAAVAAWQAVYNVAIKPAIDLITAYLRAVGSVVEYLWGWVNALTMVAWHWLYDNAVKPVLDAIVVALNWVGGVASGVWDWIKNAAATAWQWVANAASSAKDWVVGVWQTAVGWFQGVWNSISGAAKGPANAIKSTFSGVMEDIKGIVKGAVNWIIDTVNSMIGKVNSVAGKVPGAPKLGTIPRFATGTNFAPGGVALVGERGPELVDLPRGSRVTPNNQIGQRLAPSVSVTITGPVNIREDSDIERLAQRVASLLDRSGQVTNMGLAS